MKKIFITLLFITLYLTANSQIKISQLTEATSINTTDLFLLSKGDASRKLQFSTLKNSIFNPINYPLRVLYSGDSIRIGLSGDDAILATSQNLFRFNKPLYYNNNILSTVAQLHDTANVLRNLLSFPYDPWYGIRTFISDDKQDTVKLTYTGHKATWSFNKKIFDFNGGVEVDSIKIGGTWYKSLESSFPYIKTLENSVTWTKALNTEFSIRDSEDGMIYFGSSPGYSNILLTTGSSNYSSAMSDINMTRGNIMLLARAGGNTMQLDFTDKGAAYNYHQTVQNPYWLTDKTYVDSVASAGGGITNGVFKASGSTFTYYPDSVGTGSTGGWYLGDQLASKTKKYTLNGILRSTNIIGDNSNNVGLGFMSLYDVGTSTGYSNTAVGYSSLPNIKLGKENVAIGANAAQNLSSGDYNVIIGKDALFTANNSLHRNVAIGYMAMYNSNLYGNNVAIGYMSGYSNNGGANINIGYSSGRNVYNLSNRIFINSIDRANEQGDTTLSLIYGKQHENKSNQYLKVNGYLYNVGTYGEIFKHPDSAAYVQSIPTGSTYTKVLRFTDDGDYSNTTPNADLDKITITKAGKYKVNLSLSYASGTANVKWTAGIFVGGVKHAGIGSTDKALTAGDVRSTSLTGIINVTSVPVDVDYRVIHDNGGSVDLTYEFLNLVVDYLGE